MRKDRAHAHIDKDGATFTSYDRSHKLIEPDEDLIFRTKRVRVALGVWTHVDVRGI